MTLLLPREVSADSAWLTALAPGSEAPPQAAELRGTDQPLPLPAEWQAVAAAAGPGSFWQQRVRLTGLAPASRYELVLASAGQVLARCSLETLPETLPASPDDGFRLLLGSCFSVYRDPLGASGRAFLRLPAAVRPQLAMLTGDQVYLDTPTGHFLLRRHSPEQLAAEFCRNYLASWGQETVDGGFAALARGVATLLTGDDHELWNNAPNVAAHLPDTWTAGGREAWTSVATELFDAFQSPERLHSVELPPLSVRVVDTRFGRSADRSRFVAQEVMQAVCDWLTALTGPGVLALGQPIFAPSTGWRGHLTDWTITDYRQYEELVRALLSVTHDVVVLTGDVHFGRVAVARLPNGRRIIEIVASPTRLVHEAAGCKWRPPPASFPARPIPGAVAAPIEQHPFNTTDDHFAGLTFWRDGDAVAMQHTAWLIGDGSAPRPLAGFAGRLH